MFKKTKNCKKRKKTVLMVIESIVKYLKGYGISSHVKNCKVYFKGFPSAKTRCMKSYNQNSDHIIVRVGTNYIPMKKQQDVIADNTVELALKLKTNSCDVAVSKIVSKGNQYRKKVSAANHR